jgi:EAL and modified HD-GYP domain-containing signal transduction protein
MTPSPLPVYLSLLADPKLALGALRLELAGPAADELAQMVAHPEFPEPIAKFPRVIVQSQADALPPQTLVALQAAGYQVALAAAVFRVESLTDLVLPAAVQWVDGPWFLAPPAKPAVAQAASRALALKLVQLVVADADARDIEDLLRQDPAMSYHLLRLVNSPGMGATRRITSFSQAIMILGRQQLRRWLNLMLFSARPDEPRSAMLLAQVMVRARSMELLAKDAGLDRAAQDLAFMAGLFSMLGTLFGLPLPEVLKPLEVSEVLVDALLHHAGPLGGFLAAVACAEVCDMAGLVDRLAASQLTPAQFTQVSFEAHQWMLVMVGNLQGSPHD